MRQFFYKVFLERNQLATLLWGLFLYQYLRFMSHLWLPETTEIVSWTLAVTLIVELIPFIHWLFRRAFQIIGILYVHLFILKVGWIGGSEVNVTALLKLNMEQFFPYLWFALAAWIIYLYMMRWGNSKSFIYTMIIGSVLMFSVVDSFSVLVLWDHVAWMILSGILLVTLSHFKQFSVKHPDSWNYMKDYPGSLVRTVFVLIFFIMLGGVLAPNLQPVLTDPYTAWKNWQGETVPTFGKGFRPSTGGFSGEPGPSGYSRDDSQLGGGFDFDYTTVMAVDTTHASYWRGETRSYYTGRGWEQLDEMDGEQLAEGKRLEEFSSYNTSQLETVEAVQSFTIFNQASYPVLFGAYRMEQILASSFGEDRLPFSSLFWHAERGEVSWTKEKPYPESYTVTSQVPVIEEDKLRQASASFASNELMDKYIQLPNTISDRMVELAETITADAANDYDKMKALEQYLRLNYPYNNHPDFTKMKDDFVDSFLFEIEEGYCDYYSTAMAIMARSIGIPTRWVKGYTTGTLPDEELYEYSLEIDGDEPAPGYYIVNNANAHSWVEVYFDGFGWIPFEPTAGFSMPLSFAEGSSAIDELSPQVEMKEEDIQASSYGVILRVSGISLLVAALAAAIFLLLRKTSLLHWFKQVGFSRFERSLRQTFIAEFNRMLKYAGKRGYHREEHETAREALVRWREQSGWLPAELEELVLLFEKAKYSRLELSKDTLQHAVTTIELVKRQLK